MSKITREAMVTKILVDRGVLVEDHVFAAKEFEGMDDGEIELLYYSHQPVRADVLTVRDLIEPL